MRSTSWARAAGTMRLLAPGQHYLCCEEIAEQWHKADLVTVMRSRCCTPAGALLEVLPAAPASSLAPPACTEGTL